MPKNRRFGFIHGNPEVRIIAHELGHGAVPQWNKNFISDSRKSKTY